MTAAGVERLKPDPAKRLELPDGLLPGLYLVIQPSGAKSWAVRYRHEGRTRKHVLGRYPMLDLGRLVIMPAKLFKRSQQAAIRARRRLRKERSRKSIPTRISFGARSRTSSSDTSVETRNLDQGEKVSCENTCSPLGRAEARCHQTQGRRRATGRDRRLRVADRCQSRVCSRPKILQLERSSRTARTFALPGREGTYRRGQPRPGPI